MMDLLAYRASSLQEQTRETKSEYAAAVMGVDSKWIKDHFG